MTDLPAYFTYIDHIPIRRRIVTGNGPSRVLRYVDAGSVNEQRMKEYCIADLHFEILPSLDRRQILRNRGGREKYITSRLIKR